MTTEPTTRLQDGFQAMKPFVIALIFWNGLWLGFIVRGFVDKFFAKRGERKALIGATNQIIEEAGRPGAHGLFVIHTEFVKPPIGWLQVGGIFRRNGEAIDCAYIVIGDLPQPGDGGAMRIDYLASRECCDMRKLLGLLVEAE